MNINLVPILPMTKVAVPLGHILVEEQDDDNKSALAETEKATSGKHEGWADGS